MADAAYFLVCRWPADDPIGVIEARDDPSRVHPAVR